MSEFRRRIEPETLPGVLLVASQTPSTSWINGRPPALPNFQWPLDSCEEPLSFLGCVSLAEVQSIFHLDWLPERGTLLFFVNPDELGDGGEDTWTVVYSEHAAHPDATWESSEGICEFPVRFVQFSVVQTPPPPGHPRLSHLGLTEIQECDLVMELWWEIQGGTCLGHLGGWHKSVHEPQPELQWQSDEETAPTDPSWKHLLCLNQSEDWGRSDTRLAHYAWMCFWSRPSNAGKRDSWQTQLSLVFN